MLLRIVLGSSAAQTYITTKVASYLSNKLHTEISVGKVDIALLSDVELEEVLVLDHHRDTLFYIGKLRAGIRGYEFSDQLTELKFGDVYLRDAKFYMREIKGEIDNNLEVFMNAFGESDTTSSGNSTLKITSTNVKIDNLAYIYDDANIEHTPTGIDWDHINIWNMYLDLDNFELIDDVIKGDFKHFSLKEISGFELLEFTGDAIYSDKKTEVENLIIKTPNTDLDLDVQFKYDSVMDYAEFVDRVKMRGFMRPSKVSFADIAQFAPDLYGLEEVVEIEGKVRGRVNNMTASKLDIKLADMTRIKGRLDINGLPEIDETFIQLDLKELVTSASDIRKIPVPPFDQKGYIAVPGELDRLGRIEFKGNFTGFINDFVAYGNFGTKIGRLDTDLQLARDQVSDKLKYKGKLVTQSFHLGKLLDLTNVLGELTMKAEVKGIGFDKDLSAELNGNIRSLELNKYDYKDIDLNGNWDHSKFQGDFHIEDENLKLDFDGLVDFSQELPKFKFDANCEAHVGNLNWLPRDSSAVLKTGVHIKIDGNSINNVTGIAALKNFKFDEGEKHLHLNRVEFLALTYAGYKTLKFESDHAQSSISGNFDTRKLAGNFEYMLYKIFPSFFTSEPEKPDTLQRFNFKLNISELGDFSNVFIPGIKNIHSLQMEASLDARDNLVKLDLEAGRIALDAAGLKEPKVQIYSANDTIGVYAQIEEVELSDSAGLKGMKINSIAASDMIKTQITWDNKDSVDVNNGDIQLEAQVLKSGTYKVDFLESKIDLKDSKWKIADSNYVLFDGKEITVSNLRLENNGHYLGINGYLSEDAEKTLNVELNELELKKLNAFLPEAIQLDGIVDGKAVVKDVYNNLLVNSNFDLKEIEFNKHALGTGKLYSFWQKGNERVDLNFFLKHQDVNKIKISGGYYPFKTDSNLLFDVELNKLPVASIEPFVKEYINEVRGQVDGKIKLTGKTSEPQMNGGFTLTGANAHVVYLNADFKIRKADFFVMPDLIGCDYISIYDQEGNEAKANVSILHDNFANMNYDIWISADNGLVAMNTTEKDNELFYGNAKVNPGSTVTIETGRNGSINMDVKAGAGAGTKIFLPLDYASTAEDAKYIFFVDTSSTNKKNISFTKKIQDFEGFSMNFDLEVEKEAEFQLIFDETLGDVIKGRGEGDVTLTIDQEGNFNIFGTYDIIEGDYLFTLESIVNKRFSVRKGSKIRWNGDAMEGQADITAVYQLKTNLFDLGLNFSGDENELKKRIPIDLELKMTGNYLAPDFKFDFKLPSTYADYENYLSNMDDGDKNIQVISLLLLNKFVPVAGTAGGLTSGNAIGKSLSELLSNQLSNWLSKISNDVDIGVDYKPGDEISANELRIALSTQLWNDRISLQTNVGVQGDNPSANQSQSNNQILGDFKVEYKISEDGKIKGSVFHRSNDNTALGQTQFPYTQGAGVIYQEEFETVSNLWCRIKKRMKSKEKRKLIDCAALEKKRLEEKTRKQNEKMMKQYTNYRVHPDSVYVP